jgi:hypothetical protein
MNKTERLGAVEGLVRQKLGAFYDWNAPIPIHDIGPSDIERFARFEEAVREIEEKVRQPVEELGDEELRALLAKTPNDPNVEWFKGLLTNEIKSVVGKAPIWVALGFGHPDHAADFNYWSKVGLLSVQEATLLSVGLEPNKEHFSFLELVRDTAGQPNKNAQALFLSKRYRLMQDHFPIGVSSYMSISPTSFMKLLKKVNLEVPEDLKAALAYLDKPQQQTGKAENVVTLSNSEKGSMLKMIAAMACEQYGFDPTAVRSQAVSSLRQDLDSVGLPLDDKTIRKWLREACEMVPKEYWEKG